MLLPEVTTVFVYFLFVSATNGLNAGTKFTKEPPSTLYVPLGSDARFQWEFTFGDSKDWNDFEEIVWGKTDHNGALRTKYITIEKVGNHFNPTLDVSVASRATWTGNISQQQGCQIVFILKNVSKSDQTTYGCRVTVWGEEVRNGPVNLFVTEPPTISIRANRTLDVEEGDNVTLRCDANGDPIPLVTWKKDGQILQQSNTTASILITNIELRDAGTYVCTAKNRAGSVSQGVLVRVIQHRPHFNRSASSNAVVKSWIGQVTTIRCAVYANPLANITWFKEGRAILDGVNSTHDVSMLTLTLKTVDDFGLYSCNATNSKGTAWYHITVEQLHTDECSVSNGGCSHRCVKTAGSYKCECPDQELILASDNKTCEEKPFTSVRQPATQKNSQRPSPTVTAGCSSTFLMDMFVISVVCLGGIQDFI